MIQRHIAPDDPAWQRSYPSFRDPLPGESLPGFLLDLDQRNGFDAGQTCRVIRLHAVGPRRFGPGYFLSAGCFDLSILGELAGALPLTAVLPLTARPLVEWLFGDRSGVSETLAPAPRFRICPACLADGLLPILFLFDQVRGCAIHGVQLVDRCSCGEAIVPFVQQAPGQCHVFPCEQRYVELAAESMSLEQAAVADRYTGVYADLLAFANTSPAPLSTPDLVSGLRALVVRSPRRVSPLFSRLKGSASLRAVADVLAETRSTASELDAASRAVISAPAIRQPRAEGVCPNPACVGTKVCKDGRLAPRNEAQYVCLRCGTRFTRTCVLFAFVDLPGYAAWHADFNRRKLAGFRTELARVCAQKQLPLMYLSAERAFLLAKVPSSPSYQSDEAGLKQIVANSNAAAGAYRR